MDFPPNSGQRFSVSFVTALMSTLAAPKGRLTPAGRPAPSPRRRSPVWDMILKRIQQGQQLGVGVIVPPVVDLMLVHLDDVLLLNRPASSLVSQPSCGLHALNCLGRSALDLVTAHHVHHEVGDLLAVIGSGLDVGRQARRAPGPPRRIS